MDTLEARWEAGVPMLYSAWTAMLQDVQQHPDEEACGLLAGKSSGEWEIFPVTNSLHSPVRFYMQPEELVSVFNQIDERGWELLAIYHSHLHGPPVPSPTDLAEFHYPGVLSLIWSTDEAGWVCRAFRIEGQRVYEVALRLVKAEE